MSPGLSNGCGVAQQAHNLLYLGQVSTRPHSGTLVINPNLETNGTPIHKLDAELGLDGGNGSSDIFGVHITMAVELPAGIAYLDTSLGEVDGDALTYDCHRLEVKAPGEDTRS
ncbi:hypothetical protein H920_01271 [Fukomys damarensis]|uniref:Uncharacterized protein n=1 Tax=Fukomys damarensis TaxID=885580 RepID=A0A091DYW1_FUKDA|nr:hypothetical protein H920_01271 [Fukomys damarensis]